MALAGKQGPDIMEIWKSRSLVIRTWTRAAVVFISAFIENFFLLPRAAGIRKFGRRESLSLLIAYCSWICPCGVQRKDLSMWLTQIHRYYVHINKVLGHKIRMKKFRLELNGEHNLYQLK